MREIKEVVGKSPFGWILKIKYTNLDKLDVNNWIFKINQSETNYIVI